MQKSTAPASLDIRRSRGLPIRPYSYEHSYWNPPHEGSLSVILYGHLRSYSYTLPLTLHYLSRFSNLHFFVHTWDVLDIYPDSPPIFLESLKALLSNYGRIIAIKVDQQIPTIKVNNPLAYMYYSMWSANLIKREHENASMQRYSRCLKLRPDVLIQPTSNQSLPSHGDYFFYGKEEELSDICALSSSFVMDRICNFL